MDFEKRISDYGMTSEQYEASFAEITAKVQGNSDKDWTEIIDQYSIPLSRNTLRNACSNVYGSVFVKEYFDEKRRKEMEVNGEPPTDEPAPLSLPRYKEQTDVNKDGSFTSDRLIEINEENLKNPEFLLNAHGYDPLEWELVSARNSIWNQGGKSGVKNLYASKINVKPRTEISQIEIEEFYEDLVRNYKPTNRDYFTKPKVDDGVLYEIPIMDLHYGKFASGNITNGSYDYIIAEKCFNTIITEAIEDIKSRKVAKILMPIGNDLLHFDNVQGTTTRGTAQDTNMRHQEMFKGCVEMLIDGITALSKFAPVELMYVPGNHDFSSSWHVVMTLWAYFHEDTNVLVDVDMHPRKYCEWGNSLIMYAHGDKEGKRADKVMQVEAREAWGRTKYHEAHLAHLHSEQAIKELGGLIIRNLPSVTGEDNWSHESGFVGAVRKCICFIWDKEKGLKGTNNIVID